MAGREPESACGRPHSSGNLILGSQEPASMHETDSGPVNYKCRRINVNQPSYLIRYRRFRPDCPGPSAPQVENDEYPDHCGMCQQYCGTQRRAEAGLLLSTHPWRHTLV